MRKLPLYRPPPTALPTTALPSTALPSTALPSTALVSYTHLIATCSLSFRSPENQTKVFVRNLTVQ